MTMTGPALIITCRGRFLEVRDGEDVGPSKARSQSAPPALGRTRSSTISIEQQLYVTTLLDRAENVVKQHSLDSLGPVIKDVKQHSLDSLDSLGPIVKDVKQHSSDSLGPMIKDVPAVPRLLAMDFLTGSTAFGDDPPSSTSSGLTSRQVTEECGLVEVQEQGVEVQEQVQAQGGITLMVRNIPCGVTQGDLARTMDWMGLSGRYDFLYVPMNSHRRRVNVGYAFVNLVDRSDEEAFAWAFDGFCFPGTNSQKACIVEPARLQGSQVNMDQFSKRRGKTHPAPHAPGRVRG